MLVGGFLMRPALTHLTGDISLRLYFGGHLVNIGAPRMCPFTGILRGWTRIDGNGLTAYRVNQGSIPHANPLLSAASRRDYRRREWASPIALVIRMWVAPLLTAPIVLAR